MPDHFFQKTTDPLLAVSRVKHSADYASLQEAVNSLTPGDTLIVNRDYTLTSTVDIVNTTNDLSGDVVIFGMGSEIRPSSNGTPTPLLRIRNTEVGASVSNITITGIRFKNDTVIAGSGIGEALQIFDGVAGQSVSHIRLEDSKAENFAQGLIIRNAFDVLVQHCLIRECQNALRCETTMTSKLTGQIRVFGGMFLNNETHIAIDGATGMEFDHIELFGFTCGHQRTGKAGGAIGISINKSTGGVFAFGSHFEDLSTGIRVNSGVFVAVTSVVGCKFITISGTGVDFSPGSANAIATVGNIFRPNSSTFLKSPSPGYLFQGFMAVANETATNNIYPTIGLLEDYGADAKTAFRVAVYSTSSRPPTSSLPEGSVIFNTSTSKLNIVKGTGGQATWVLADGNPA